MIITQGAHFMSRAMFSAKDALLPHIIHFILNIFSTRVKCMIVNVSL